MGNNELRDLLQDRFHGHELPVGPGTWSAIAGQLAVGAGTGAAADGVSKLFGERFAEHAVDVDPSAWANISSQLGHGVAAGTSAGTSWFGGMGGWIAAGVGLVAVVGGTLYFDGGETPASLVSVLPVEHEVPAPSTPQHQLVAIPVLTEPTSPSSVVTDPQRSEPTSTVDAERVDNPGTSPDAELTTNDFANVTHGGTPPRSPFIEQEIVKLVAAAHDEPARPADTIVDPVIYDEVGANGVELDAARSEDPAEFNMFLPNVFTPGTDNINDFYLPVAKGLQGARIVVYSVSNGEMVFQANELKPWSGDNYRTGQPCPEGYYLYAIEAIGPDGRVHTAGETVRLFR